MRRFYLTALLVLILLTLPITIWLFTPSQQLEIAIIDKTVPDETYREHLGLTWLLNHLKIRKNDGTNYEAAADYFGFHPDEKERTYKIRSLLDDYTKYDVLYLADTYGVYEGDLPWSSGETVPGDVPLFGGLQEDEWEAIENRLESDKESLLIAEYNSFASPTEPKVRKRVEQYLGLTWSGWVGRYFDELDPARNGEIPKWIVDAYGKPWDFHGGGLVLVRDQDSKVVVLEEASQLADGGVRISLTKQGGKKYGKSRSVNYDYWFDIVQPSGGSEILAEYSIPLKPSGKQSLEQNGIPTEFPAVLSSNYASSKSVYFAGDFNDRSEVPYFYQIAGLETFYRFTERNKADGYYWNVYAPIMEGLLKNVGKSPSRKEKAEDNQNGEVSFSSRVKDNHFEVEVDGKWLPMTIKGVNIGMGIPGHFPGEAAITEEEYYRWFEQIGEMNANTIRVYTLHPPEFYHALKSYNDQHENKLYVFHGVWIDEEGLANTLDAFNEDITKDFEDQMDTLVDVIHGNKTVGEKPGHASGVYRSDISEYVIGWILGIEWNQEMVLHTNEVHADVGQYAGKYFQTKEAKPFEHWLAKQMDHIADYEIEKYQSIRPISFTNWPTTDILDHPSESTEEDIVGVDPNAIYTKGELAQVGEFASYHIYPYYPDFMNFDENYQNYTDQRGNKNGYAGYLHALRSVHRMPVLVAEFGVPSSRGKTHENAFGWNQGFLSEKEAGSIIAHLYEDIIAEQYMGGLIFTWQDEWFKRTWNTMDYDNPDRRPFWSNAQTNEQQFGLLSFDRNKVKVDGDTDEWTAEPLYEKADGMLKSLSMDTDERYLYFRVDVGNGQNVYPIILLDTIPDQGNTLIQDMTQLTFQNGLDFVIQLKDGESRILIDQYYDFFAFQYGHELKMIEEGRQWPPKNSGAFSPIRYALRKEYHLKDRNETLPFSSYETGKLLEGDGNPSSSEYNSLADFSIGDSGVIELRIPWLLLQAKDPSEKEFIGNLAKDGMEASVKIGGIKVGVVLVDQDGSVVESFPASQSGKLPQFKTFTWENWQEPQIEERLKQSYDVVRKVFSMVN